MSDKIIGETTPIRIGLVIAFLGVFGASVWWASSVNSKLDTIITTQAVVGTTISELKNDHSVVEKELNDITLRVAILESKVPADVKK